MIAPNLPTFSVALANNDINNLCSLLRSSAPSDFSNDEIMKILSLNNIELLDLFLSSPFGQKDSNKLIYFAIRFCAYQGLAELMVHLIDKIERQVGLWGQYFAALRSGMAKSHLGVVSNLVNHRVMSLILSYVQNPSQNPHVRLNENDFRKLVELCGITLKELIFFAVRNGNYALVQKLFEFPPIVQLFYKNKFLKEVLSGAPLKGQQHIHALVCALKTIDVESFKIVMSSPSILEAIDEFKNIKLFEFLLLFCLKHQDIENFNTLLYSKTSEILFNTSDDVLKKIMGENQPEFLRSLLKHSAKNFLILKNLDELLKFSLENKHDDILLVLLEHESSINLLFENNFSLCQNLIDNNNLTLLEKVLQNKSVATYYFSYCAKTMELEDFKSLINKVHMDFDNLMECMGNIALEKAMEGKKTQSVQYFLNSLSVQDQINRNIYRYLSKAAFNADENIWSLLCNLPDVLDKVAVFNSVGLVNSAVNGGNLTITTQLLADPRFSNSLKVKKNGPLICAIISENIEMIDLLLSFKETTDLLEPEFIRKICFNALKDDSTSTVIHLLKHQAIKNNFPVNDRNLIQIILDKNNLELLNRLLEIPNIDSTLVADDFALCHVAKMGSSELFMRLFEIASVRNLVESAPQIFLENVLNIDELVLLNVSDESLRLVQRDKMNLFIFLLNIDSVNRCIEDNTFFTFVSLISFGDFAIEQDVGIFDRLINNPETLKQINGFEQQLFVNAISSRSIQMVSKLLEYPWFIEKINFNDLEYLEIAAAVGSISILEMLLKNGAQQSNLAMNNNAVLNAAIKENRTLAVDYLLNIPEVRHALAKECDDSLCLAIGAGDVDIVKKIIALPTCVVNMPKVLLSITHASDDEAATDITRILMYHTGLLFKSINQNNNEILRNVIKNGHTNLACLLLKSPFVLSNITALNNACLRLAARYDHFEILDKLLEIPEVVDHITANNNAAYRAAADAGNLDIMNRLNEFDAVRNYAYSLERLAMFEENSMRALDDRQESGIMLLKARYQQAFEEKGLALILEGLESYLVDSYHEHPVIVEGIAYPLSYRADLPETVKIAYYQNIFHTAYRYLFLDPNPWMSDDAQFVVRSEHLATAEINLRDRELVAYLWLAVTDPTFPLPEGYRLSDLQAYLAKELSLMGRQHNWDKTRLNPFGKKEEYDDLEGDKPTCSKGVTQGLAQTLEVLFTNFAPQFKTLAPEIIKRAFCAELIGESDTKLNLFNKLSKLDFYTLVQTKIAIDELVYAYMGDISELNSFRQVLLTSLLINESELDRFIEECCAKFGSDRIMLPVNFKLTWVTECFASYVELIHHFAKNTLSVFYSEIDQKIQSIQANTPTQTKQAVLQILLNADDKEAIEYLTKSEGFIVPGKSMDERCDGPRIYLPGFQQEDIGNTLAVLSPPISENRLERGSYKP